MSVLDVPAPAFVSAFKDQLLAGKVAFIAGGTSGINLGIARRFAQLGARVAVAGRNPEKAAAAAASIDGGALGFSCDVRDYAATRVALESTAQQFGPLAHVCAAKAGVNQLIRVLAMEWGPMGVRVNGISPGPIAGTEGMARLAPTAEAEQAITSRIALRRYGAIAEIAESAVFLCSDSAAYITGTILDCDGGSQLGDAR
jgi:NAD(P)-dependent dehydrogenase (short-subunit alcohol dehydrogenase family)